MKRFIVVGAALALFGLSLFGLACSEDRPMDVDDPAQADAGETAPDVELQMASANADAGVRAGVRTYEVVVENLTPATGAGASQPFSPPVLATHHRRVELYRKGAFASNELAQIAEDAVNSPMVDRLRSQRKVYDVVEGDGVILPGESAAFEIRAFASSRRLSAVFMLVNTNDGFGGLEGVRLPRRGEKVFYVHALDAGSELNTERIADIPGPCCGNPGAGPDEHRRIRPHPGILGTGDLDPDTWGWTEPVARVTVRRVNPTYKITLTNLTPATVPGGSQVFSPPVVATHGWRTGIFRPWRFASDELALIAEDGDTGPMVDKLEGMRDVFSVVTGAGPVPPGGEATYTIEAAHVFSRFSMAFMLVNTNDGFSGASRARLPLGGKVTYYLNSWDAGSEKNTELISDIPGPCCGNPGAGPDEHRRIRPHPGILGTGDLSTADYGWDDPAAMLTITRIK